MDNEKGGQRWNEPITTEDVLRQIDEANRRVEEPDIDLEYD